MSSPRLPTELLDQTVDILQDSTNALKSCCLVSKSWIPRVRKHLFANTAFRTPRDLKSWKSMFPDPSTSPARYTKSLFVKLPLVVTASDAEEGGWIRTFSRVVHFNVDIDGTKDWEYLILISFHGFSPAIKSLLISFSNFPPSRIFNLINSFPLLEDLSVITLNFFLITEGYNLNPRQAETPSSSPPVFTGCLKLSLGCRMDGIVSRLLLQPDGIRFRKLDLSWEFKDDISSTRELVAMCYSTLESLSIQNSLGEELPLDLIDLSKATKLQDVMLVRVPNLRWITAILRTITRDHKNLQRITIDASDVLNEAEFDDTLFADPSDILGRTTYERWLELDHLLAQLWESHSICLEVLYGGALPLTDENLPRSWIRRVLPVVVGKGRAKLIGPV